MLYPGLPVMHAEDRASLTLLVPDSPYTQTWRHFRDPVDVVVAREPQDVARVLAHVERFVSAGLHAAGFLAYEAASGIDAVMVTHAAGAFPVAVFGAFRNYEMCRLPERGDETYRVGAWAPDTPVSCYRHDVARIRQYIRQGTTYQVNYSFRLRAAFEGSPLGLFGKLCRAQRARYSAFVQTDSYAFCSASPELFFFLDGEWLESRPMKGTGARGLWFEQDEARRRALHASEKNRAENIMIVDMIRNDLGRIAVPGSVQPVSLFRIERYPTVLQMVSSVRARTRASFSDIIRALFPCASITGAPKVASMRIIRELERSARGIYTGCIGYVSPGRRSLFNVAIRTVTVDRRAKTAEYGTGGGIVWDSSAGDEYAECVVKAEVLAAPEYPEFQLLETLLWHSNGGYVLLNAHLERLRRSGVYFGFAVDPGRVDDALASAAATFTGERRRVRLCVDRSGRVSLSHSPLPRPEPGTMRLCLAAEPVDERNPFLYHKTTNRDVYERALEQRGNCDDVLLWNRRCEVTESTLANVVVARDGKHVTPPVQCGLLPGTFRRQLLESGEVAEAIVTLDELKQADEVFLVNSVRGWMKVDLPVRGPFPVWG